MTNESASDYGAIINDVRQSYIQGYETEEEEQGKQLSAAEVRSWSPDRVAKHLESVGVEKKHCDVFREQEFSGEVLLGMDQSSIFLKELELGPIGRRLRTWQKIRALQDEVSPPKPSQTRKISESSQPPSRRASNGSLSMLNRGPQHGDRPGTEDSGVLQSPGQGSALGMISGAARQSPRPSAASVRSLGHSRRQSSIDQAAGTNSAVTTPQLSSHAHAKQSSFDRNWNMNVASGPPSSTGPARPASSHLQSASTDKINESSRDSANLIVGNGAENDRGYMSGSEADAGKSRKLLRKRDALDHHRASSYETGKRTSFFRRASRASSPGHSREISAPVSVTHIESGSGIGTNAQHGPSLTTDNSFPPTVTNLESLDGTGPATSPRKGLRAISDAVTGKEKALHSLWAENISPTTEVSTPATPSSGTPSAPHSMDLGDANQSKFSTPIGTKASAGTKRKSKKKTSAYVRGLERKSPQEQIPDCDYYGWMKKKSSNLMTNWKPRLFVLRGRRLSYYYSETDTEEKGLIDISGHRVLSADNERLTGLHASITGATSSPTSPQVGKLSAFTSLPSTASPTSMGPEESIHSEGSISSPSTLVAGSISSIPSTPKDDGGFIFKLVPPRVGMSKAVNFTKPTVHYFAVPSVEVGRLWMAALMKATIDRDEGAEVITTYQQKTISLAKARARKERPPALRGLEEEEGSQAMSGVTEVDSVLEKVDEASDAEKEEEEEEEEPAGEEAQRSPEEAGLQMREVTDLEHLVSTTTMSPGGHSKKGSRASGKRNSSADGLGIQGLGNGGQTSPLLHQMKNAGLW